MDDGEIEPLAPPPLQFDETVIKQVSEWLGGKFSQDQPWRLDELLYQAEDAGFDWTMRRCLVLTLFRAYSHSETDFKNMRAEALEEFVAPPAYAMAAADRVEAFRDVARAALAKIRDAG